MTIYLRTCTRSRPDRGALVSTPHQNRYACPSLEPAYDSGRSVIQPQGGASMAASQVVVYFEKQEDALLFTLAASSVISAEGAARNHEAAAKIAQEICKASRITTESVLNTGESAAAAAPRK